MVPSLNVSSWKLLYQVTREWQQPMAFLYVVMESSSVGFLVSLFTQRTSLKWELY